MSDKFETSKASGPHYQLSRLEGEWAGIAKTWFEPGKPPSDESPVKGNMKLVLGGRFLLHEYTGSMQGNPLEGMAIIGYQLSLGKYQVAWVDSFHNGTSIMFSEGERNAPKLNVTGSYVHVTPEKEHYWGWRTELEIVNDDEVVFTSYNVPPPGEGQEEKATELVYKRVKQ